MNILLSLILTHKKAVIFYIALALILGFYAPYLISLVLILITIDVYARTNRKKLFFFGIFIWLLFHYAPFFIVPFDTLSLWGHEAVLQTPEGLSYIRYGVFNEQHVTPIPDTKTIDAISAAILDDHSVVWTSVSTSTNSFILSQYKDGVTKVITTIPLLNLPEYAMAYEKHTAPTLDSIQSYTNDVYKDELIVFPNNTVGWLDFMAMKGDESFVTDVSLRLRKVNVDTGETSEMEVVRVPEYNVHNKIQYDQKSYSGLPDTYIYPNKVKMGDLFFLGMSLVVAETPPHGSIIYIDSNQVILDGLTRFDDSNVPPGNVYLNCSFDKPNDCVLNKLEGKLLEGLIYNPNTLSTIFPTLSSRSNCMTAFSCLSPIWYFPNYIQTHNIVGTRSLYYAFTTSSSQGDLFIHGFTPDHRLAYASMLIKKIVSTPSDTHFTFAIDPVSGAKAKLEYSANEIVYFK